MRGRRTLAAVALAGALWSPMAASAEPVVGVRSVRVGAVDVAKTAAFYETVFGFKEVARTERPGLFEIVMNVGATVDEAKAARTPKIVVINEPADAKPPVSNVVLRCTELQTLVARARSNGGSIEREPTKSAATGSLIAFIVDPAGNRLEVIQEAN
ncbi:VOC family protein [Phenylobacterium sp.]|uniref:VOC family protein n=1 Tax=Phenylobacterium sp. TaxID=1871053 RepID=UPI002F3EB815